MGIAHNYDMVRRRDSERAWAGEIGSRKARVLHHQGIKGQSGFQEGRGERSRSLHLATWESLGTLEKADRGLVTMG